ncbi:hypothetical protein Q4I28_005760 [Leishmania naiffi]|uniref:RDD domain-containing protein n=1 Tax=Leishmania naiffi TaxID=5678 RepID=A0AAW3BHG5_9TRYP
MTPSTSSDGPSGQAKAEAQLPADYQYRLDDCEMALARHRLIRDGLKRGLLWSYASVVFDSSLVFLGGFFGWQRYRIADAQTSFLRGLTVNPLLRRVFTPLPLLSMLIAMLGVFCLPVDLAAISVAQERILLQERAIENGNLIRQDIICEGTKGAAASQAAEVPIQ